MPNAIKAATEQISLGLDHVLNNSCLLLAGILCLMPISIAKNSTLFRKNEDLVRLKENHRRAVTLNWHNIYSNIASSVIL